MPSDSMDFSACLDLETGIGEGPVWDDARGILWFVDIPAAALYAFTPSSGGLARHNMPDQVTSIGLTTDERLILALRTAVHYFTPATGKLELLATPDVGAPVNRLNDGKVGPDGCFWVGSMHVERPAQPTGTLFRITPDGECTIHSRGLRVSNGLAWSPDHRTMYHSDSRGPYIKAYDFDPATGATDRERIFATPDEATGLPDGAAVDLDGNYWSAGVSAGCLNVFAPDGSLLRRVPVPMAAPTMPCFGGADMQTLFVTGLTRREGERVLSPGRLIACRVGVAGVPVARFGAPVSAV